MFLDDGTVGDRRLLSAAMVRAATRSQTPHIEDRDYGYGWVVGTDGSFWHSGSDGTFAWCDPRRDLVGMVLTQTQARGEVQQQVRRFRDLVDRACPTR